MINNKFFFLIINYHQLSSLSCVIVWTLLKSPSSNSTALHIYCRWYQKFQTPTVIQRDVLISSILYIYIYIYIYTYIYIYLKLSTVAPEFITSAPCSRKDLWCHGAAWCDRPSRHRQQIVVATYAVIFSKTGYVTSFYCKQFWPTVIELQNKK